MKPRKHLNDDPALVAMLELQATDALTLEDPADSVCDRFTLRDLVCASNLTPKEKLVIQHRFFDEESRYVIATKLGLSEPRIAQIERKALDKLRKSYTENTRIRYYDAYWWRNTWH